MKLYSKKLRGIEDLEREKKRLKKQAKQLDKEDFMSLGKTGDKKKSGSAEKSSSLLEMLPIDNPIISLLLPIIEKKLLSRIGGGKESSRKLVDTGAPKKNIPLFIAKEFIGGYLKWKAIELSYKGVKRLIKKRKEKTVQKNLAETAIYYPAPRK